MALKSISQLKLTASAAQEPWRLQERVVVVTSQTHQGKVKYLKYSRPLNCHRR